MAPPPEPPSFITIRVKVPPGHIPGGADEFTLGADIPVAWNIGRVRERIQEAIPSSPTPERQRLLYGGRALVDNEQTLADALNIRRDPTQREYVVHLLIKGEGNNTAPVPHFRGMHTPNRSASPAQAGRSASTPPAAAAPGEQGAPQNAVPPHFNAQTLQQQQPNAHQRPPHQGFHVQGVVPNCERIMIHQHTMNFPHPGQHMQQGPHMMPGMGPLPGMPGIPGMHPMHAMHGMPPFGDLGPLPGMPHQPIQRPAGPSALDQARQNIADMRRMLDELRSSEAASEAQRTEISRLEERTQALSDYIDPLRLSAINNPARSQTPRAEGETDGTGAGAVPVPFHTQNTPHPNLPTTWQQRAQQLRQVQQPIIGPNGTSATDVTCYLLSSPTGPQAILYSPQHGTFTGTPQYQTGAASTGMRAMATATTDSNLASSTSDHQAQANNGAAPAVAAAPAQGQPNGGQALQEQLAMHAAQQDPLGPLGPILGHVWLLIRILIFSYFLLGANMGWRRPLALMAIGVGFWMIRAGLLGDGGAVRQWWDGIMNEGQRPAQQQAEGQGQQQGAQQGQQQQTPQAQAAQGNGRPGQMPTPEQLAQRLLNEDARARDQARNERYQWLRDRIRPIERAVALLLASLWPGVGEAYVRAREQEERRRAEEEIAARRREEEEKQRQEEEREKQQIGEGSSSEKPEGMGGTSGHDEQPSAAVEAEKPGVA